jgi:hypothetical protein
MSDSKKHQKNRRDSIKDWRFHVLPPERSLRQFTTSVNPVWRSLPFRVVYGLCGSNRTPSELTSSVNTLQSGATQRRVADSVHAALSQVILTNADQRPAVSED